MRVFLNQEERVFPWLQHGTHPVSNAYLIPLAQQTVLMGPNADHELRTLLKKLPNTPGVELVRGYFNDKSLVFVDTSRNPSAAESSELPSGVFPEILESSQEWSSIMNKTQGSLRPGEERSMAFNRLLGPLVQTSQVIEILDPYLTCPLLANAMNDGKGDLFWLDKLLNSSASKVIIYSSHPTNLLLSHSAQCKSNERLNQISDEQQRLSMVLDYLIRQKEKYGYRGSIEFRSSLKMPHDRYLRFGLINGSVYVGLPKGIDPFEKDPLESVHKLFSLDKHDWKNVMDSQEWGDRDRTISDGWKEIMRHDAQDRASVTVFKQMTFRPQFSTSSTRRR